MPAAILFFATLLIALLVPRSFYLIPVMTGFGGTLFYILKNKRLPAFDKRIIFFALATASLSFLSIIWSVNPEDTLGRSITMFVILFSGALMFSLIEQMTAFCVTKQKYFTAAYFAAYILTALFLLLEYTQNFPVMNKITSEEIFPSYGLNRSVVSMGLLFLPLLYLGYRMLESRPAKILATFLTAGLILTVLCFTQSQTAQIAILCGLLMYGIAYLLNSKASRRILLVFFTGACCLLMLATPFIPSLLQETMQEDRSAEKFVHEANIHERLEIWTFIAGKIAEKPLTGHGVEATKNLKSDEVLPYNNASNFLHPHNAFLQIWVETGILGALLTCAFFVFVGSRILAAPSIAQPLYLAVTTSILCMLSTGYGLWQSWQLGLILTAAALTMFVTRISANRNL